jgi:hypothetical protein
MRIFLSYASEDRSVAEGIYFALVAEGHQVFFDRKGTEPGEEFNRRIRDEISRCHKFIFLISPQGVERGRYTLTELSFAQDRWLHPAQNVLPVMVSPTDLKLLPSYLKAVTILEPQGDVAAEVAAKLRRRKGLGSLAGRRQALWAAVLLIVLGSGIAALMRDFFAERPVEPIKPEEIIQIRYGGFGYRYNGPEGLHLSKPDYLDHNNVSRLVILEDDKPLGPDHSGHKDIEDVGKGRYSHWIDNENTVYVYFSASDNSDPTKGLRINNLNN